VTVSNAANAGATSGAITVTDTIPAGLTLVSMTGTGWTCSGNTCNRSDALGTGASYPAITVKVNVAANATSPQVNQVSVSGGGSSNANTTDSTTISPNLPVLNISRTSLNFGYNGTLITSPQPITITFTGGLGVAWTASSNQSNITVLPASGTGNSVFQITVARGPSGVVTVSAPAASGSPKTVQVNVASVTPGNPFGSFDTPANNTVGVAGAIAVTGWALDNIEITNVDIWRDPIAGEPVAANGLVFIGDAVFVVGARPDVESGFPNAPWNYRAGWGYLMLTNGLPATGTGGPGNGIYHLHAIAHNKGGTSVDLCTRTITVDNAHATRPFGTIDTPGQGGTASGNQFVNFGWALTQNPFCIPVDGSTITVTVDGVTLGHPVYAQFRNDIATAFPGLCNSQGAVGYFLLDTTTLSNGVHTIGWLVFDNQGRGDGIGSRFINVFNSGSTPVPAPESVPATAGVALRRGFDRSAGLENLAAESDGAYSVDIQELDRVELQVGATSGDALPPGSTLKDGVFYWQLAPGFFGKYPLTFTRSDGSTVQVRLTVHPKSYRSSDVQ